MLKLSKDQMVSVANLIKANLKFESRTPILASAGGCNSCNGGCQSSCGGCSGGCGTGNTCAVTLDIFT